MPEARVFGIVTGSEAAPEVAWLENVVPVTPELLRKTGGIEPQRILRVAVKCQEAQCVHFDGTNCRLAERVIAHLPAVADGLHPCPIRTTCRWFAQEGRAACSRCPQVVTHTYDPPANILRTAAPP